MPLNAVFDRQEWSVTGGLSGHKAPRIKRVMREVVRRLPDVPIAFVDHWEDSDAIGIAVEGQPKRLVYVCTAGSPAGRYYADIEFPPKRKGGRPFQQGPSFESLGMDELVALVRNHLMVAPREGEVVQTPSTKHRSA